MLKSSTARFRSRALLCAGSLALASAAAAQEAPIVLPGAPGAAPRALSADEAVKIADTRYSPDDVRFLQDMIVHHAQAVEMSALVEDRTNRKEIIEAAGRITASQDDEMKFMRGWLAERGEPETAPAADHGGGHDHGAAKGGHGMIGMASPEQMKALAGAKGAEFDRLFLTLMTKHHDGALKMVDKLFEQPGAAYDPVLFEFVNDVKSDQTAEIKKMNALLAGLSPDPRVGLKPGFRDAGEAAKNMTLVASLPKPAGFFDPANPAGLPLPKPDKDEGKTRKKPSAKKRGGADEEDDKTEWSERSPLLDFSNTDIAFSGDTLIAGNYHGFNIYKLPKDGPPVLVSSVVCPGGQGDVSIVGDLLIMSVEQTRGRVDCGLQGVPDDVSPDRFRGLRIFDISDLKAPRQVGQVQTCRGSHTHSVVSGPGRDGKIIVYNSGTARVRDEKELPGCIGDIPGDDRTALFRIDVIEIPVADPSKARIIDSPEVFADPKTGRLAGLWRGGDHGDDTQETSRTDECHDITVFPSKKLAAGACSGNGIIFDISDPRKPKRLDAVTDKGFAYWHSATFNNDGTKVLFTDEWGGGGRPRCRAADPAAWGADAIYDIVDGKLVQRSLYKLPAPQADEENCVAHNGSVVPAPGRDIFVQAWYQGGVSVIDFTDSANPVEIAFFDRGPIDKKHLIVGGYWSAYWYDGRIYGTEITRGLDVFELSPSEHLTANEIAAAKLASLGETVNAQQQYPAVWPDDPVVARAYVDQLTRSGSLASAGAVSAALDKAAGRLADGVKDAALAAELRALAAPLPTLSGDAATQKRAGALAATLNGIAARLR